LQSEIIKKNIIKITKQHELKTIVATRQKSNDFAIVSLQF
jgi:hypothetical protein